MSNNKRTNPRPARRNANNSLRPATLPRQVYSATKYHPTGNKVGFPQNKKVRLVYCESLTFAGSLGAMSQHVFRLNSLFDPDFTATGHQPLGFDQWAQFYNHYVVNGCEWEIQTIPSESIQPVLTGAYVSDDSSIPSNATDLMELGAEISLGNVYTGDAVSTHGSIDIAEFFRRPRGGLALDDNLKAAVTSNPFEQVYLNIVAQSPVGISHNTHVLIRLVYDCMFMEPKDLAAS